MAISYVIIENYKSIKRVRIDALDINVLIGANGSGKSNIISAIKFFYDNLNKKSNVLPEGIFDVNNKYSNKVRITVGFDLSKIKKRCYENLKRVGEGKYKDYYENVVNLSKKNITELTMISIKNKGIVWDLDYEQRKILYNLFPMYIVDTRKINLVEWENLWLKIGDLGKLDEKTGKAFKEEMRGNISQYDKSHNVYDRIEKTLSSTNIVIRKYSPKQLASITAKLYFGGEQFEFDDNKLIYFSDGTNSYNYIRLFIQVLSVLPEIKIKEPMLIIDEPEISLHHSYIDYMCGVVFEHSKNVQFVLSTHSARLIKNILVENSSRHFVYHINLINRHTYAKKMKMFDDNRQRVVITDQHSNAYFSKMLVSVEGVTEIEVLQNPFLKLMYPVLGEVDVMQGMANEIERKIISPNERKNNIPILYTIDMDKVIEFDVKDKRMKLRRNKYFAEDIFLYTDKRRKSILIKKRIDAMVEKCAFRYKMPIFFSSDSNLNELKRIIKEYYSYHNYFVMNTTIEGALINQDNLDLFIEFLNASNIVNSSKNIEIGQKIAGGYAQEKLNIYRILCCGKCDLLMGIKELKKKNKIDSPQVTDMYDFLSKTIVSKTDGWVSKWIEYYICNLVGVKPFDPNSYKKVQKILEREHDEYLHDFSLNFKELHSWLIEIENRFYIR